MKLIRINPKASTPTNPPKPLCMDDRGFNHAGINRWWDVIGLPPAYVDKSDPKNPKVYPGHVKIRSRFWDYWGEYVFHCHILIHEDTGMMQNVYVRKSKYEDYNHNPCDPVSKSLPLFNTITEVSQDEFEKYYPASYPQQFNPLKKAFSSASADQGYLIPADPAHPNIPKYPEQKQIGIKSCETETKCPRKPGNS